MQRLDVLPALRARRPLQVAQAEVADPVGAAHAFVLRRRGLGGRGRVLAAAEELQPERARGWRQKPVVHHT